MSSFIKNKGKRKKEKHLHIEDWATVETFNPFGGISLLSPNCKRILVFCVVEPKSLF